MRSGDDFKLALTLLDEDGETPLHVEGSISRLSLCHDERFARLGDYGFGWTTWGRGAVKQVAGYAVPSLGVGRLNFQIPAASTGDLCGRYRMFVEVDLYDGDYTELEGVIQVRPGPNTLGNAPRIYFQPGITPIGIGIIPGGEIDGVPTDSDGFKVTQAAYVPAGNSSSILGIGTLGFMVLGGSGFVLGSGTLGSGTLG